MVQLYLLLLKLIEFSQLLANAMSILIHTFTGGILEIIKKTFAQSVK